MIKMPPDQLHYWTSITQGSIEPCVVLLPHCCCCFSSRSPPPPVWIYWLDGIERQEDTHRRKSKHVNGKNSLSISPHLSIPSQPSSQPAMCFLFQLLNCAHFLASQLYYLLGSFLHKKNINNPSEEPARSYSCKGKRHGGSRGGILNWLCGRTQPKNVTCLQV